jgi:hypothetical protein
MRPRTWVVIRVGNEWRARNVDQRRAAGFPFFGMRLTPQAIRHLNTEYADDIKFNRTEQHGDDWHIDVPLRNEIGWLTDVAA